jgi:hypothetical protein
MNVLSNHLQKIHNMNKSVLYFFTLGFALTIQSCTGPDEIIHHLSNQKNMSLAVVFPLMFSENLHLTSNCLSRMCSHRMEMASTTIFIP